MSVAGEAGGAALKDVAKSSWWKATKDFLFRPSGITKNLYENAATPNLVTRTRKLPTGLFGTTTRKVVGVVAAPYVLPVIPSTLKGLIYGTAGVANSFVENAVNIINPERKANLDAAASTASDPDLVSKFSSVFWSQLHGRTEEFEPIWRDYHASRKNYVEQKLHATFNDSQLNEEDFKKFAQPALVKKRERGDNMIMNIIYNIMDWVSNLLGGSNSPPPQLNLSAVAPGAGGTNGGANPSSQPTTDLPPPGRTPTPPPPARPGTAPGRP